MRVTLKNGPSRNTSKNYKNPNPNTITRISFAQTQKIAHPAPQKSPLTHRTTHTPIILIKI